MTDIPAYDWRIITAGVRDKDELLRLRFAYVYGFEAGRAAAVSAIHGVKAPPSRWPDECLIEACKRKSETNLEVDDVGQA